MARFSSSFPPYPPHAATPNAAAGPALLAEFSAHSLGDFELTADLDLDLSARALAARDNARLRNELFTLLGAKIRRFVMRYRTWDLAPWSLDDLCQEAFIVFADVLATWTPLALGGRPAGFGAYFLRVFPLRLAGAVRKMRGPGATATVPWSAEHDLRPDVLNLLEHATVSEIMADICGHLNAVDSTLFRLRVERDPQVRELIASTGISRRTLHRRWGRIVRIAREVLLDAG